MRNPSTFAAGPLATAALAIAQVPAGRLSNLFHVGVPVEQRSAGARGPLTPPNRTFAIWGPIFAANITYAVRAVRRDPGTAANRYAALAFLGNALWTLEAQFRGFTWRSVAIISATAGAAAAGFLGAERRGERLAANALGALAGWLTIAAAANVESTLIQTEGPEPAEVQDTRALVLAGAASAVGLSIAAAGRGNPFYAAALGWGLGGIALRSRREGRRALAGLAVAAAAGVALTTVVARSRRDP